MTPFPNWKSKANEIPFGSLENYLWLHGFLYTVVAIKCKTTLLVKSLKKSFYVFSTPLYYN